MDIGTSREGGTRLILARPAGDGATSGPCPVGPRHLGVKNWPALDGLVVASTTVARPDVRWGTEVGNEVSEHDH